MFDREDGAARDCFIIFLLVGAHAAGHAMLSVIRGSPQDLTYRAIVRLFFERSRRYQVAS